MADRQMAEAQRKLTAQQHYPAPAKNPLDTQTLATPDV